MIKKGDIIIRREAKEAVVWLRQSYIITYNHLDDRYMRFVRSLYKSSLSPSLRKYDVLPDNGKSWRWAKINGTYYYSYDNIPNKKPTCYKDKLPEKTELLKIAEDEKETSLCEINKARRNEMMSAVETAVRRDDVEYFMYEMQVDKKTAEDIAVSLAWLRMIKKGVFDHLYESKEMMYEEAVSILASRKYHGLRIKSKGSLKNKLSEIPKEEQTQRAWIMSGKYGNTNASIVGKMPLIDEATGEINKFDFHQAVIYGLYMNIGGAEKESMARLYDRYCDICYDNGIEKVVSERTFTHHLSRHNIRILTAKERHGGDYFRKQYLPYVPSEKLSYAHSLITGDGSGTVAYKYYDAKGTLCTMKLYVMMLTDVASRYIMGYSFAPAGQHSESPQMLREALKMAVESGERKTLFEFVSDNHGAFSSAESKKLLHQVFQRVRNIAPMNSQANPAEVQFRVFKNTMRGWSNFTSTSWVAGVEGQANPDYLSAEKLPTYPEAIEQFKKMVLRWNTEMMGRAVTPAERFSNKNPQCEPYDERILRYLFGDTTMLDVSYMRGFVKVEKKSKEFIYEIPDYFTTGAEQIAKATGYSPSEKVKVVYDADKADLYTTDERYIMSCAKTEKAKQSFVEKTQENQMAENYHRRRKERALETVDAFTDDVLSASSALVGNYALQSSLGVKKEQYNKSMDEIENTAMTQTRTKNDWKKIGLSSL